MSGNPQRGDVEIEIGAEKYTLRPSFEAIARIEQRTGKSICALFRDSLIANTSLTDAAIITEECVKASGGKTSKDIGSQIRSHGLSKLLKDLGTVIRIGVGGDDEAARGESEGEAQAPGA